MERALHASLSSSPLKKDVPAHMAKFVYFHDELMRHDAEMENSPHVKSPHFPTLTSVPTITAELPPNPAAVPESGAVILPVYSTETVAQPTAHVRLRSLSPKPIRIPTPCMLLQS